VLVVPKGSKESNDVDTRLVGGEHAHGVELADGPQPAPKWSTARRRPEYDRGGIEVTITELAKEFRLDRMIPIPASPLRPIHHDEPAAKAWNPLPLHIGLPVGAVRVHQNATHARTVPARELALERAPADLLPREDERDHGRQDDQQRKRDHQTAGAHDA